MANYMIEFDALNAGNVLKFRKFTGGGAPGPPWLCEFLTLPRSDLMLDPRLKTAHFRATLWFTVT
jgi:hypothetical protein